MGSNRLSRLCEIAVNIALTCCTRPNPRKELGGLLSVWADHRDGHSLTAGQQRRDAVMVQYLLYWLRSMSTP